MARDTFSLQDASTYQVWDTYLKQYRRYAPETIILITRSEVQKFGIPTSKNIGDMHRTGIGTEGLTDGRTDGRRQGQCDYYMPLKSPLGA